jgi:hypothetical protein
MNEISKNMIITYAKALRTIQTEQIDPYLKLIEGELIKQFPELKDAEDNALNWTYDIFNADSSMEVVKTLNRLENIVISKRREKWVCNYCGKNTYDMDIDYVNGTDHLACIFENEVKYKEHRDLHCESDSNTDKVVISNIENQINNILTELNSLKKKFEDDGK